MAGLGSHLLIDLWGVPVGLLDDLDGLRQVIEKSARAGGATVIESHFHRFNPQGVSGVVILAESHVAIHTWPEIGFVAGDVFTCGEPEICRSIVDNLVARLRPRDFEVRAVDRGLPRSAGVNEVA
jgi:S-adenosylmethionine decarboxylase